MVFLTIKSPLICYENVLYIVTMLCKIDDTVKVEHAGNLQ